MAGSDESHGVVVDLTVGGPEVGPPTGRGCVGGNEGEVTLNVVETTGPY